jgi:polyhydroxyalkanoate synthesis regulator protein
MPDLSKTREDLGHMLASVGEEDHGALKLIAGVAIAASLASAGMAYYGQQQQAASAERLANYNFAVQKQQMEMQARMQGIAADQQYQAGLQNASAMENQALRVEQEARERAKRMRSEN